MADLVIVDDDGDMAGLLGDYLESEGHQVRVAHDGSEGREVIFEHRPDLAILDVEMPAFTGPQLAHSLFVHDLGFENIPLILCSGVLGLRDVADAVGTPYFLSKPYRLDALNRIVAKALAERQPPHPRSPEGQP